MNAIDDIYSEEIELCRENGNNAEETFFDLVNKVKNDKFQTDLFEKRDIFPFSIVEMPKKSRNTPSDIIYTSIGVGYLRIARAVVNLGQKIETPLQYLFSGFVMVYVCVYYRVHLKTFCLPVTSVRQYRRRNQLSFRHSQLYINGKSKIP